MKSKAKMSVVAHVSPSDSLEKSSDLPILHRDLFCRPFLCMILLFEQGCELHCVAYRTFLILLLSINHSLIEALGFWGFGVLVF